MNSANYQVSFSIFTTSGINNPFAIFKQTLIHPQIAQIIAEKAEEMASNLRKSAKSADKIPENILPKFWRRDWN